MSINIRTLIGQVMDERTDLDSPQELAKEVLTRVSMSEYGNALEQCLPQVVAGMLGLRRSRDHAAAAVETAAVLASSMTATGDRALDGSLPVTLTAAERIRWEALQEERTWAPSFGWALLRNCTAAMLAERAGHLERKANSHLANANRCRAGAAILLRYGVASVSALTENGAAEFVRVY
jgi:hypothetical protein